MKISSTVILILLLLQHLSAAKVELISPSFKNIDIEAGLSNYNAGNISQDSLGYLWVSTSRGLNRYDGENFSQYFFDPDAPEEGVPHDMILNVCCAQNRVFIRSNRGTTVFNQKTETWQKIASVNSIKDVIPYHDKIYVVFNKKICLYDCDRDQLIVDPHFEHIKVQRIIESNDEFFWFVSSNMRNIYCYDKNLELRRNIKLNAYFLKQIPYVFNNQLIVKRNKGIVVYDIIENTLKKSSVTALRNIENSTRLVALNDSVLAISTMGNGLFFYHSADDCLEHVHEHDGASQLNTDLIKNIFVDRDHNLWVSTFDKGVNVSYCHQNQFNDDRSLNVKTQNSFINCIESNSYTGDLIFGTRTEGIISKDDDFSTLNKKLKSYDLGAIVTMYEDTEHKLWVAGNNRFIVYDQVTQSVFKIDNFRSVSHIYNITQEGENIYILSDFNGIMKYDLDGNFLSHFALDIYGINELVHCDDSMSYFCSINSGLYSLNRHSDEIINLPLLDRGKEFDWEGAVSLVQQNDSIFWVGTLSWGLLKVNRYTLACTKYTKNDGLQGNDVTAIEIDDYDRLWLSTSDGLACMYSEGQFFNYSAHDGIGNYQFHRRSSLQTRDGHIFFGGNNGLTYFHPSNISFDQELKCHVIFEEILCDGQRLSARDQPHILNKSIAYTKAITLPYSYTGFSLKYTIPELFAHDEIKYAYKLEGWDDQWHETKGGQPLFYSNLSAGDYTLLVKASRRYSAWSPPTTLNIHLKVAPWKSWWAYTVYALLIIGIIYSFILMAMHRKLAKSKLLAEQDAHKRIDEINEMKHRFFTNISHELRTPLTIIHTIASINPEELSSGDSILYFLRNLRLNTERLKRLVDQLLIFRNLERDTLQLEVSDHDIVDVVDSVIELFQFFTKQKMISFSVHYQLDHNCCAFDRDKLEKVLNNLLDNAIKYTPPGGTVTLEVAELKTDQALDNGWDIIQDIKDENSSYLLCRVKDTGIGIDSEALSHIFDRYYKASSNLDYSGTGIGLNFVKRLIDLHKGYINAESEVGEGTCISILLPLEYHHSQVQVPICHGSERSSEMDDLVASPSVDIPESFKQQTLLIVEDDIPLNNFLLKTFEDSFKVYSTYNSHEGLIMAKNIFPDIIISDVMMTEVDEGLKFCNRIKEDPYISHIPIVLLTARAQKHQIMEGYAHGADAYVTKPFDINILVSNVISLLENRARLQKDMFNHELPKKEEDKQYNQNDIVFIKKINEVISTQYEDPKFNIASLSRDLLMSRSALYKKFTQVTKLSPNEYLRKFRINKSIELMEKNELSITQIVELVGFSSRSGFYSSFKKEKGMTPSDFMKVEQEA